MGPCGNQSGAFGTPAVFKLLGVSFDELVCVCVWSCVFVFACAHVFVFVCLCLHVHTCVWSCVKQRLVALAAPCLCVLVYSIWLGPIGGLAFFEGLVVCQSCMHVEARCASMPAPVYRVAPKLMQPLTICGAASSHSLSEYRLCTLVRALCHSTRGCQDLCLSCFAVGVVTLPVCHLACLAQGFGCMLVQKAPAPAVGPRHWQRQVTVVCTHGAMHRSLAATCVMRLTRCLTCSHMHAHLLAGCTSAVTARCEA